MRYLVLVATLSAVGWIAYGRPHEQSSPSPLDLESVIAREIERGAPTENTGMDDSILGTIPLEANGRSLEGGDFRLREVVLAPGAEIRVHGHDERPAIAYVLEGELIEHRGGEPLVRRAGDFYIEGPEVVHWVENRSPRRVRVISIDIAPGTGE